MRLISNDDEDPYYYSDRHYRGYGHYHGYRHDPYGNGHNPYAHGHGHTTNFHQYDPNNFTEADAESLRVEGMEDFESDINES